MPPETAQSFAHGTPDRSGLAVNASVAQHRETSSALHDKGIREYRAGRHADAVAWLTAAVKASPTNAAAWSDLGAVHARDLEADHGDARILDRLDRPALRRRGHAAAELGAGVDAALDPRLEPARERRRRRAVLDNPDLQTCRQRLAQREHTFA